MVIVDTLANFGNVVDCVCLIVYLIFSTTEKGHFDPSIMLFRHPVNVLTGSGIDPDNTSRFNKQGNIDLCSGG